MPFGYPITVVALALCTLAALAPPRRPRALRSLGYRLGLVVGELPVVVVLMLLASTLLALGQGDVDSPGAWAAVGLALLTPVGLAVLVRRQTRAGPAVDRALRDGLGPEASRTRRRRLARALLAPLPILRHDVRRVANVPYGDAGRRNLLDVYHRRSRPSGGPTLVYFHGGRFRSGGKSREARPLLHRLASQGWVCVSANYRLRPEARFPDELIDVKKVIAWLREHGGEYGADPSLLFAAGSSAGGYLAGLAALTPNDPAFQPGFEDADTSVTAAIALYAYYGDLADRAGPDAPPFLVIHGDRDTVVPVERARRFVARLRGVSANPVVYAELPGAQHSFDLFHSIRFEAVLDGVEAFAAWVRERPAIRG